MKFVASFPLPTGAIVELTTPEGRPFWMRIDDAGLHFHSDRNSAGSLTDKPITKSSSDVFEWIKEDISENGRKPFGERVRIQPKPRRT